MLILIRICQVFIGIARWTKPSLRLCFALRVTPSGVISKSSNFTAFNRRFGAKTFTSVLFVISLIRISEIAKYLAALGICPSDSPSYQKGRDCRNGLVIPVLPFGLAVLCTVKASRVAFHFVPLRGSRTHFVSSHLAHNSE